jgi:hypothetical protein
VRKLPAALALAAVLMVVLSGPVLAAGTVHQVTNAGNDPYAACTVGAGTGTNYPRSEVEPFGAVNPRASANLVSVW